MSSGSSSSNVPLPELSDVDWFLSLPDVCLSSLELGKIVYNTSLSIVFAHKSNPKQVIKVYEFNETFESLLHFKREIDAYIRLVDLHRLLVPRMFGYEASWRHFLGFINMEALGPPIGEGDLIERLKEKLVDGLHFLHDKRICHGDLNLKNILLSLNKPKGEKSGEIQDSFEYKFIDFGESVYPSDEVGLELEMEQFRDFLNGSL